MAELTGLLLGQYFLLERLGGAGIAETYRARPTTTGGLDVRLRIFRPPADDPTAFREHFAVEVEKVWHCRHPHIRPLLAFGSGDGLLYCASRYDEGEVTLADVLEQQEATPWPLTAISDLLLPLCAALQYAHERGIVHGNVQPASILIAPEGLVQLSDFAMRRAGESGAPLIVREPDGDPAYLAPEQFLGHLQARSDVYALGVLLHRLLTGTLPGDDLRQQLPPSLEAVLSLALAERPEERYPDPATLAAALITALHGDETEVLEGRDVHRHPDGQAVLPRDSSSLSKSRRQVLSLVLLLAVVLGLASSSLLALSLPQTLYHLGQQLTAGGWRLPTTDWHNLSAGGLPTPTRLPAPTRSSNQHQPRGGPSPTLTPTVAVGVTPIVSSGNCASGLLAVMSSDGTTALLQQLTQDYRTHCPSAQVDLQHGTEASTLSQLQSGEIAIGAGELSADPSRALQDHPLAALLYVLISSPDVALSGLSSTQIAAIYRGQITNWAQVGGPDEPVEIIPRAPTSSISSIFQAFVLHGQAAQATSALPPLDDDGQVVQMVATTKGAISYVPLEAVTATTGVTVLSIDGATPSLRNLQRGSYSFWSVIHLYTQQQGDARVRAYLSFCSSGQEISSMSRLGAVALALLSPEIVATHLPGPTI
jgi:phosphate transport system substrate-binding protein